MQISPATTSPAGAGPSRFAPSPASTPIPCHPGAADPWPRPPSHPPAAAPSAFAPAGLRLIHGSPATRHPGPIHHLAQRPGPPPLPPAPSTASPAGPGHSLARRHRPCPILRRRTTSLLEERRLRRPSSHRRVGSDGSMVRDRIQCRREWRAPARRPKT
nr:vegetative cell wall protein gp1-like [Aegilops tauschii subsp. strangulata]